MCLHISQFFEWLPWISNYQGTVLKSDADHLKWLREQRARPIDDIKREYLKDWYPADQMNQAKYIEFFEIGEYGSQPVREEILRFFPMIPRTK